MGVINQTESKMTDHSKDLKVGTRVRISKVAYSSCVEDGFPYLDVGNTGTIKEVDPSGSMEALYHIVMDDNMIDRNDWPFWHSEVEEIK